jgi:GNAT superfamily N-acetyltransferase
MTTSIHDVAAQAANLRAHWVAWGGTRDPDDALVLYRSGLAHGLLNGVLRLRGRPFDEAAVEAERRLAGVPWRWWVGPDSDAGVARGLAERGYQRRGGMPVMATRLDRIPDPPRPDGLTIDRVDAPAGVPEYVEAYASSFGVTPELFDATVDVERRLRTDVGTLTRLVGRIDGRAVATAAVLVSADVAGLYWIGTEPAHRSRGIAAALTAAAMAVGRDSGTSVCTLQASSLGEPVYRRLGFTPVSEIAIFTPPAD